MKYIYHYYAKCMMGAHEVYVDGIASRDTLVDSYAELTELKQCIAKTDSLPVERLVICSLTLMANQEAQDGR
jgi:hypothetical protein